MRNAVDLIVRKRDGGELSELELQDLVRGVVKGTLPDYQLSALLMAVFFRGMSDAETVALTEAMLHSGRVLALRSVRAPKIDKHSTGGVGDKISICLGPLVAACGVAVPMISGRGLGHTGGTLDKLEAIPGYRVDLSVRAFERTVRSVGISVIGQTAELAPADRRMYSLRDVTGTVESIPLIVASILSKKLAAGIDGLVLDVKVGRGAFMKDEQRAQALARALVAVGRGAGKRVIALLTDMSSPIGLTVGNALETREAIDVLRDQGPADTRELTLALGVEMLLLAGVSTTQRDARRRLETALASGAGFERLLRMVRAHGGDDRVVEDPSRLPRAKVRLLVAARKSGAVTGIDPLALGLVAVGLGAGRTRADQKVDPSAGIEIVAPIGTSVRAGDPVAFLHARTLSLARAELDRAAGAFSFGKRPVAPDPRVLSRIASPSSGRVESPGARRVQRR
jgi:pyrimidine-nucleoside phosphorylase